MPVIARFLWIMVVILFVLAIYTSVTQTDETEGDDNTPVAQQSSGGSYKHNSPVADDPPIPQNSGGSYQGQQTASSGSLSDILIEIDEIVPMSINDAYAAIPHKRTTFSASQSRVSRTESTYLEQMFALTDQMTAARVAALTNLYYGHGGMTVEDYNRAYLRALDGFTMLEPPKQAAEAHRQIVKAIQEQHAFLNEWDNASGSKKENIKQSYGRHAQVQSSHRRLLSAYSLLMKAYGHDNANNRTSFFDHLCALDFI